VLMAGWNLDKVHKSETPLITPKEIQEMQLKCRQVDLSPIRQQFVDLVHNLRSTGIKVSDRRAVKIQNLLAASTLMCNRMTGIISDFWVLKYIWDTEEQIEILAGIIDNVIEKDESPQSHPQALFNKLPNGEELIKEVQLLQNRWETETLSFE